MIEKVEVRRMLANYEKKIKEEMNRIENEMEKMDAACATNEMLSVWRTSIKYATMRERWTTLTEILWDISDIRCDEALN